MTAARNERQNPSSERSKQESPPRSPRASRSAPTSASRTSSHAARGHQTLAAGSGMLEVEAEKGAVDRGQLGEIGELDPLVDLVHRLPDEAELGDRAIGLDEPRIRGAAGGAEFGRSAGDPADRLGEAVAERAGRGRGTTSPLTEMSSV